jgi:hypothetical protein
MHERWMFFRYCSRHIDLTLRRRHGGLIDEVRLSDTALLPSQLLVALPLPVSILINPPAQAPVSISLSSASATTVAILSTPNRLQNLVYGHFDARHVDPTTIRLAGAPVESCTTQDVNGDGLPDLVCHVMTSQLQLQSSSNLAVLTAEASGVMIMGAEGVSVH